MPDHIVDAGGPCIPAGHGALALRFYSYPIKFSYECDEIYPIKR